VTYDRLLLTLRQVSNDEGYLGFQRAHPLRETAAVIGCCAKRRTSFLTSRLQSMSVPLLEQVPGSDHGWVGELARFLQRGWGTTFAYVI